jgi:hypothetical protein
MWPLFMLFGNPAVKILEDHLWEDARRRYLQEHPSDRDTDVKIIKRRTAEAYKEKVAASLKRAEPGMKAKWRQFKHVMFEELRASLATVLRMSEIDWYAMEIGRLPCPNAIAVPYELLKQMTSRLLFQQLRGQIDFEDLNDESLQALSSYAVDEGFEEVLEHARHHHQGFEIGKSWRYVIVETIHRDRYFLDDDEHHSAISMIILSRSGTPTSERTKKDEKEAVRRWFNQDRKTRADQRRFCGDGWEISSEELKSWVVES